MKTNLLTFPKGLLEQKNGEFAVTKWKKDFEAELQQMRDSNRNLSLDVGRCRSNLIKEILGET